MQNLKGLTDEYLEQKIDEIDQDIYELRLQKEELILELDSR